MLNTSKEETAVCNLGSINLGAHVVNGAFDFEKLAFTTEVAIKYLDRVNYYGQPTPDELSQAQQDVLNQGTYGG